jgi:hypothetical protein
MLLSQFSLPHRSFTFAHRSLIYHVAFLGQPASNHFIFNFTHTGNCPAESNRHAETAGPLDIVNVLPPVADLYHTLRLCIVAQGRCKNPNWPLLPASFEFWIDHLL